MIDFTDCAVNKFKAYGGANGNKINVLYDGTSYMLKFPPAP
ncbi:MAG: CtkA family protein, partial [Clostridium sp.]